jgi:hypothetical protein
MAAGLLLFSLSLPQISQASTITVYGTGFGRTNVSMLLNGSSTPVSEYAIEILIRKEGVNWIAYCVDLFTSIGFGTYNTTMGSPGGYPNGLRAAWIYENYAHLVTTNQQAAALQVALWDVVHDGGDGLSVGNIRLSASESALLASANAIVAASAGKTSWNATILYNQVISTGAPAQTLITSGQMSTPEPTTLGMTGAALLALGMLRRKPRK